MKEKRSFFERLAGSISLDEDKERDLPVKQKEEYTPVKKNSRDEAWADESSQEEGELSVDVYQTDKEIVIEAMIAGVKPEDLHLSITRDMVTIKGKRDSNSQIPSDDYFYKELYWGPFSRTILLPHEIEIEEAEAVEKHGLLIIRLPKLDKERQAKLRVKSI